MKRVNGALLLLLAAFAAGCIVRFYRLGDIPAGFHRDEAFLGYNAYSLLQTGRDMTGNFLPLHFRSFLYSPGGYAYLSMPFIAAFGLSPFAVRLASALFGSLSILVLALLLKQFDVAGSNGKNRYGAYFPVICAWMLAVNPWHINLSRTATEHIPVLFFLLLGTWLYIRSLAARRLSFLLLAFLSFFVTLFMYQAPRLFLPLLVPILLWNFFDRHRFNPRAWGLYALLIVLPVLLILRSPHLGLRIQTVSVFATQGTQLTIDESLREDGVMRVPVPLSRVFHNKLIGYGQAVLQNYFAHLSYPFLFTDAGFPDRYRVPGAGLLYLAELPLLLIGLLSLIRRRNAGSNILLGWLLLAPVGSALTFDDVPNLQRTVIMVVPLAVCTAVGIWHVAGSLRRAMMWQRILVICGSAIILTFSISLYLHAYYVHQLVHRPWFRMEGYRELVAAVNRLLPQYDKAVITNRESAPTVFFLFYSRYDPATFQRETAHLSTNDFDRVPFGKYEFTTDDCPVRIETVPDAKGKPVEVLHGVPGVLYVNAGTCPELGDPRVAVVATITRGDTSTVSRILLLRDTAAGINREEPPRR